MTLIVVAMGPKAIHLASDYRLTSTDPRYNETMAGLKQLSYMGMNDDKVIFGDIAFTGTARYSNAFTRESLSSAIEKLGKEFGPEELRDAVKDCLNNLVSRIRLAKDRRITAVVTGIMKGFTSGLYDSPFCYVISNFETSTGLSFSETGENTFRAYEIGTHIPRVRHYGAYLPEKGRRRINIVTRQERRQLITMMRANATDAEMRKKLAEVIKSGAGRLPTTQSVKTVSEESFVSSASHHQEQRGENFGGTAGVADVIFFGINIGKWMRHNINSADGTGPTLFKDEKPVMRDKNPDGTDKK